MAVLPLISGTFVTSPAARAAAPVQVLPVALKPNQPAPPYETAPAVPTTSPGLAKSLQIMCERHPYPAVAEQVRQTWHNIKVCLATDVGAALCYTAIPFLAPYPDLAALPILGSVFLGLAGGIGTIATAFESATTVQRYFQRPEPDGHVYESDGRFTVEPRSVDKKNRIDPIEGVDGIRSGHNVFTDAFTVDEIIALPGKNAKSKWLVMGWLGGKRVHAFLDTKEKPECQKGQTIILYGRGAADGSVHHARLFPKDAGDGANSPGSK